MLNMSFVVRTLFSSLVSQFSSWGLIESNMPEGFDKATDFIFWHRRILDIGGLWPMEPRGFKFYTLFVYCIVYLFMAFAYLARVFGNLERMIESLLELTLVIMVMAKMLVLKFSVLLRKLMRDVAEGTDVDEYNNDAEKKIYMSYVSKGLRFFKLNIRVSSITSGGYYLKAMITFLIGEILGRPTDFVMLYHIKFFINITDYTTYALVCVYQTPMIYVFNCHLLTACFMWSLIAHVSGQLSVLAFRIKNVKATSSIMDKDAELAFRRIVQKHCQIIRTSTTLDNIFKIFLLVEFVICSALIGLCMYSIIVNTKVGDVVVFITYILCILSLLLTMFGWCLAGEFLMMESLNVLQAYYECEWYNMPPRCQKLVIICMIRAHSVLHITAGGFYIYSLESFTGVVKSAMAFVSMLRTIA